MFDNFGKNKEKKFFFPSSGFSRKTRCLVLIYHCYCTYMFTQYFRQLSQIILIPSTFYYSKACFTLHRQILAPLSGSPLRGYKLTLDLNHYIRSLGNLLHIWP